MKEGSCGEKTNGISCNRSYTQKDKYNQKKKKRIVRNCKKNEESRKLWSQQYTNQNTGEQILFNLSASECVTWVGGGVSFE